jgi:FkbM family methyltransferase
MAGLVGSIGWKLDEFTVLKKNGSKRNLFFEALFRKYRANTYKIYRSLPLKIAETMGLEFPNKMDPMSLKEMFVDEAYKVPGFLPDKDDVVIDVGANMGDSALWWWKNFGSKVIAFEPLPYVYRILEENVKINGADVETHNIAIGDGNQIKGDTDGNMFSINGNKIIETKRLDDFNFENVNLLKIDVEGFECEVLKGSLKTINKFKPRIIIETHSKKLRSICHSILSSQGYELRVEGRTIVSDTPGMDKVTNLFYSI